MAEQDLSASLDFIKEATRRQEHMKYMKKLLEEGKCARLDALRRKVSSELEQLVRRYGKNGSGELSRIEVGIASPEDSGYGRSTEKITSGTFTDKINTDCRITADAARAGLRDSDAVIADLEAHRKEREAQQIRRSPGRKR